MNYSIISDQISQDLEEALKIAQQHHYHYVELHNVFGKSIEECTMEEVDKIKYLLKKYDMEVSNIASTVFFLCPLYENDQVSLFNDTFFAPNVDYNTHLENLTNACKIANALNCQNIRLFPFRFPDNRKPLYGTKQHIEDITNKIRKAVAIAKQYDVTLVLENCPYSHLPKGMMTIQVIKAINDPHLRLLWDPANSYRAMKENVPEEYLGLSLLDELKNIYPYISHIHIKDYHYNPELVKPFQHKEMFQGDINYMRLLAYLKEHNCSCYLSLEAEVDYQQTLNSMDSFRAVVDQFNK